MTDTLRCQWHKCGREFSPAHGSQRYCQTACRVKRAEWAKMRGSRIVNMLLECPAENMADAALDEQRKLLEEIRGEKP